jgi:hypothetical protein
MTRFWRTSGNAKGGGVDHPSGLKWRLPELRRAFYYFFRAILTQYGYHRLTVKPMGKTEDNSLFGARASPRWPVLPITKNFMLFLLY